ncbi:hypothetical protein KJ903_04975 [Patescibacteria group bacterium]|nr:hypothetical protein [Patescibacteria group bacterium]
MPVQPYQEQTKKEEKTSSPASTSSVKKAAPKSFFSSLTGLLPGKSDSRGSASKAGVSTQKYLKIKGIRDGIVELEDGGFRSVVMASSVNFSLMSEDEQKSMIFGYQDFLNSLEFTVQIIVQSRVLNIKNYLEKLSDAEKMQENELLRMQISEYKEYIKQLVELANITSNHYYVVVPYMGAPKVGSTSIMDRAKEIVSPAREVKVEIASYDRAIQELSQRVTQVVGGLRGMGIRSAQLNTQEVVELFYANYNPDLAGTEVLAELERLNIETE